ncbi:MAG: peptide deformylase [Patescibacteria group bacterium]
MSKAMKVLHNPDKQLRVMSEPVKAERFASAELLALIEDLKVTMKKEKGIGIAAPQVGVHDRVIIVDLLGKPTAFINPEITQKSFKLINSEEGCLSVPGEWGTVKRHRSVTVKAIDANGHEVSLKANGLQAIIFQHEIDHLDGVLFIDRAESMHDSESSRI